MKKKFESVNQEYGKINSYKDLTDTPGDDGTSPEIAHDNENGEIITNENFHPIHQNHLIKQSSSEEMLLPSSQV